MQVTLLEHCLDVYPQATAVAGRESRVPRAEPGHEGNKSGMEMVWAWGTKIDSPARLSFDEFSSLQSRGGLDALTCTCPE